MLLLFVVVCVLIVMMGHSALDLVDDARHDDGCFQVVCLVVGGLFSSSVVESR